MNYQFKESSPQEINKAIENAHTAFFKYRKTSPGEKASFLSAIAAAIEKDRNILSRTAEKETALPDARLQSELDRTINQCMLFASLLKEGSWVRAIIDTAQPERKPLSSPDLRQMQLAIGPVAVFGASNFPFAYSVCGGDTVAALAAGCPVVYKANPGHPETSELVTAIVINAARETGMPEGVFSMIQGAGNETGIQLVMHPFIKAVGFTGSLKGGRALFDAAAKREEPIPVYAEMGSTNPVFILPEILEKEAEEIARALAASNTASVGQFCTNPGIMVISENNRLKTFQDEFADIIKKTPPATMLTRGIFNSFEKSMKNMGSKENVTKLAASADTHENQVGAHVFVTTANNFLNDRQLWEEMFGPGSIQVTVKNNRAILEVASSMPGQLTASVWGTDNDLKNHSELLELLELKAGRIIINGVPTGVEVSPAMNHGGPYPATTDSKFTSVGTQSIYRFTKPVCYQNYPENLLPDELKDGNPKNIWRMLNGEFGTYPNPSKEGD
jgi:alpha-ketoglutaric semialdehyde dehydrogenase